MAQKKFTNSLEDALKNFWVDYVGWGRATRAEYWWVFLFYSVLAGNIIFAIDAGFLYNVWGLATLIPSFCLAARRLHDTGRSNWNILWALLPIVGWIILIVYLCQPGQTKSNKWGAPRI